MSSKSRKLSLIGTIFVSMLSICSAAVSTFAWFQANANVNINTQSTSTTITVNKPEDFVFYAYKGNTLSDWNNKGTFGYDFVEVTSSTLAAQTQFSDFVPGQSFIYAVKVESATALSIDITKLVSNDTVKQGGAKAGTPLAASSVGEDGVKYYTRVSSAAGAGYLNDGSYAYEYYGTGTAVSTSAGQSNTYYPLEDLGSARVSYDNSAAINVGWAVDIFEYEETITHGSGNLPSDYSTFLSTKVAAGNYTDRFNFSATTNTSILSASGTGSAPNKIITLGKNKVSIYDNSVSSKNYYQTSSALSSSNDIYVFFSVVFSDSNETYYYETESSSSTTQVYAAQEVATRYFKKSTSGNSNCYAGLRFALSEITVNIG